jgi:hypothetical protein
MWDLGERAKVAILSVTEGEDKPLKYPDMFAAASLMILNKTDLLPHVDFDVAEVHRLRAPREPGHRGAAGVGHAAASAWTPGSTGCCEDVPAWRSQRRPLDVCSRHDHGPR